MKKCLALLLALLLTLSLVPAAVAVEPGAAVEEFQFTPTGDYKPVEVYEVQVPGLGEEQGSLMAAPDFENLCNELHSAFVPSEPTNLALMAKRIENIKMTDSKGNVTNISRWGVTYNLDGYTVTKDEAGKAVQHLKNLYGDMFAVENFLYYTNNASEVVAIAALYKPKFVPDEETLNVAPYMQAHYKYKEELQKIVDQVDAGWTDLQKIAFVNDYITEQYEYSPEGQNIYTPYEMMVETKHGVCQAYCLLFSDLMDLLDINNSYVQSDAIKHIWNMVQLDKTGDWYQVDVTWNDPVGYPYFSWHDYLMRGETGMQATHRGQNQTNPPAEPYDYDWVFGTDPTTTYDENNNVTAKNDYAGAFWLQQHLMGQNSQGQNVYYSESQSHFVVADGDFYYLGINELKKWEKGKDTATVVKAVNATVNDQYFGCYAGGLDYFGGKFYYSTAITLESYSRYTDTVSILGLATYTENGATNAGQIYGSRLDKDTMKLNLMAQKQSGTYFLAEMSIDPYQRLGENDTTKSTLGYYLHEGSLYVDVPTGQRAAAASYKTTGQMAGMKTFGTGESSWALPTDPANTLKLFSLDGVSSWKPLAPATTVGFKK